MRVLQVSYSFAGGGAALAALDLAGALAEAGHAAGLAGVHPPGPGSARDWLPLGRPPPTSAAAARLGRWLDFARDPRKALDDLRGAEDFRCPASRRLLAAADGWDVIHLHNLHASPAWFDLRMLPELCRRKPVVLTLHDAWLTTGHCAHSFDCERWRSGCGSCPYLGTFPAVRRDRTAANWRTKADILARCALHVAAPSRWLLERARASLLAAGAASLEHLPNGIDAAVFHPGDRQAARRALGLPEDRVVAVFAAQSLRTNPFKDWPTLAAALHQVGERSPQPLLALAIGDQGETWSHGRLECRFVPWTDSRQRLADHFRAADLYLHPARADTFPYSVLEAMACGTAVIASAVGGIPEMLADNDGTGACGRLVPPGDATALAEAVLALSRDEAARQGLGQAGARRVALRYRSSATAAGYLALYLRLTGG